MHINTCTQKTISDPKKGITVWKLLFIIFIQYSENICVNRYSGRFPFMFSVTLCLCMLCNKALYIIYKIVFIKNIICVAHSPHKHCDDLHIFYCCVDYSYILSFTVVIFFFGQSFLWVHVYFLCILHVYICIQPLFMGGVQLCSLKQVGWSLSIL